MRQRASRAFGDSAASPTGPLLTMSFFGLDRWRSGNNCSSVGEISHLETDSIEEVILLAAFGRLSIFKVKRPS